MVNSQPTSNISLTPAIFHILLALADGERHGYAIMQTVSQETDGTMRLGPGTLYRSIRVMLLHNLIAESDERPDPELDDERRRYYRLTDQGKQVLQAEIERLRQLVRLAESKRLFGKPQMEGAI